MRIISGKARGTKINTIESDTTRPTLDRVRESVFNIIQNRISNSVVLDLFAGSGALGIEALSRGADLAVFCDSNDKCIKMVKTNLEKTHLYEKSECYSMDYKKCLNKIKNNGIIFDIVFIDPPYKENISIEATKSIIQFGLLKKDGIIIIETDEINRDEKELEELLKSTNEKFKSLHIISKRKYGRANLLFLGINEEK